MLTQAWILMVSIPASFKLCPTLAIPLHLIFKKSLLQGRLPVEWKQSEIVPIFKKGSRHIPLNCRPISLTSVCCKTLERIIVKDLYGFLESNHILSAEQFWFCQGRTVDDQLLLVYDNVTSWLDLGYVVDVVLFNISEAYDVVCHTIFIS